MHQTFTPPPHTDFPKVGKIMPMKLSLAFSEHSEKQFWLHAKFSFHFPNIYLWIKGRIWNKIMSHTQYCSTQTSLHPPANNGKITFSLLKRILYCCRLKADYGVSHCLHWIPPIRKQRKINTLHLICISNKTYFNSLSPKGAVILLPLGPVSLMHRNPQRRKIIHGMHPAGHKDQSNFDLNMCLCNFCGSYYGCRLTMHISFSLCCALK